ARELAPADPQVAALVGKVAYQSNNFTWSYSLLQEAVRQRQNDPAILHDLAWAAYSLGKINEARDAMQKVLSKNPVSAQAADAKEFLALTALAENPKQLMASEPEVQKEWKSNPGYVQHSWPRPPLMRSGVRRSRQPKSRATSCADGQISRPHRNASLRCTRKI